MVMKLDGVVPFGRSLDEYRKMFLLTDADIRLRILGAGDGPASFNAELTRLGGDVVSLDPLYRFDAEDIRRRFHEVLPDVMRQVRETMDDWVWTYHQSPDDLQANRIRVTEVFCEDFARHRAGGRYVRGRLPLLPFRGDEFDLALCSHFLFLYSDRFDAKFHLDSLLELLRVADEVRVFPLLNLMLQPSPYVPYVIDELRLRGHEVAIEQVAYELQKGGNRMLRVRRGSGTAAPGRAPDLAHG